MGRYHPAGFAARRLPPVQEAGAWLWAPIPSGTAQRHQGLSVTAEDVKCILHALAAGVEVTRHPLYLARTPLASEIKTQRYVIALSAFGKL